MEIDAFLSETAPLRDYTRAKQGKHVFSEEELKETYFWGNRNTKKIDFLGLSLLIEKIKNGEKLNKEQITQVEDYFYGRLGSLEMYTRMAKDIATELREAIKKLR